MSYVALATRRFDEVVRFYRDLLRFPELRSWERTGARGGLFDLGGGLRLEIMDAAAERQPPVLGPPDGRCQLVIEVADLEATRARLPIPTPEPAATSWGARLFRLEDPDGVAVWFLQWTEGGGA